MAPRRLRSLYGTAPIRWDAAESRADRTASHARERHVCRGQAARGDRTPGTAHQETADRATDRAPIQPGPGTARAYADAHRITRSRDRGSNACRDCVNAINYSEGCKANHACKLGTLRKVCESIFPRSVIQ